ncbi:hypothetical protein PHK61_06540 [Actinomycetospora lutea]|uniref:hypothetical protein n=1 Tax=Actinomycetospora lutea TaxID=663604 RepID=UPI0023665EC4|nr:hypothetical protein [Actinomycetospora lutea]MDD7938073.1 hypothetical protein [Actinomycetospora lutea]
MSAAALLTSDTPRWLFLVLLGVVAMAYLACGLLALIGRLRRTATQRQPIRRPAPVRAGARQEVAP